MNKNNLTFFNIERLIASINSRLSEDETRIELGDFVKKETSSEKVELKGEYPLIQQGYPITPSGLARAMIGVPKDIQIGLIKIERGHSDLDSDYSGSYEVLKLKITKPLELKDEKIMQPSKVKIFYEIDELGMHPFAYRKDHQRTMGLWLPTNTLNSLPTESFFMQGLNMPSDIDHSHMSVEQAKWYAGKLNQLHDGEAVEDFKNPLTKRKIKVLEDKRATCKECYSLFVKAYDPKGIHLNNSKQ